MIIRIIIKNLSENWVKIIKRVHKHIIFVIEYYIGILIAFSCTLFPLLKKSDDDDESSARAWIYLFFFLFLQTREGPGDQLPNVTFKIKFINNYNLRSQELQ
jgi:hypothetical protein